MKQRTRVKRPQWFLIRVWQFLHKTVSHCDPRYPGQRQRWAPALRRFEERHLAQRGLRHARATARFVNRYTAHRWM